MKWKVSDLKKHWGIFRRVKEELLHDIRLFHVFPLCDGFMTSSLSAIFVTQNNKAYALGENRCSMLGIRCKNALPNPVLIDLLQDVNIQSIDTGLMHTLALTFDGQVYEWGLDVNSPFVTPLPTILPQKVDCLDTYHVLQIACGSYFNLALTDVNTVVYWGYYDISQNPLRRIISFRNEPSILSLSSGLLFSAAVGSSGKVYTWTGPKRAEWTCTPGMMTFHLKFNVNDLPLGRKMTKKERPLEPRVVNLSNAVVGKPLKAVCSMRSLYILMDSGEIYITGYLPRSILLNENTEEHLAGERTLCDGFWKIACKAYPRDLNGSKWMDHVAAECINPKRTIVFADNTVEPNLVNSITQAFADHPTPQMISSYYVDDESVYIPPRLELNKELFGSESLSDVKFKLADQQMIPAHKYILLAHSQHFRNMYDGVWKETSSNVIDVSDHNPIAYKAYLHYLYNGQLEKVGLVELLEIYHLADEYLDNPLKKLCLREIIEADFDSTNVAELYDWAVCNDFKAISNKCTSYGASHLQEVLKSDGFANMNSERREMFVQELFKCDRTNKGII